MAYISEKTKKHRNLLMEDLQELKASGYRAFICKNEDYVYGMVTDGTNIVMINGAVFGTGFSTSYSYVTSKENGTGCSNMDSDCGKAKITKEDIDSCIRYGRGYAAAHGARLYTSFEDYIRKRGINSLVEI